jgi:hypothetical protein
MVSSRYHGAMSKLTPKRRHFARLVASGQSQASAYREAFDCKPGSRNQTHVESASKLARDPHVATTIRQLIDARDRAQRDRALSERQIVMDRLRSAIDDNEFGVNRLKAIGLMADVLGMRRHSLDVTQTDDRSAESIVADLEAKLAALGLTDQDQDTNIGPVTTCNGEVVDDGEIIEPDEIIETDSTRH